MFAMGAQNGTISVWDVKEENESIYTKKGSHAIRTVSWAKHGFLVWGNEIGDVYGSIVLDKNSKAFRAPDSSLSSSAQNNATLQIEVANSNHNADTIPKYVTAAALCEDGSVFISRLNFSNVRFEANLQIIPPDHRDITTCIAFLDGGSKHWILNGTHDGNLFGAVVSI